MFTFLGGVVVGMAILTVSLLVGLAVARGFNL